jgi:AcrR family transcriptional regulator
MTEPDFQVFDRKALHKAKRRALLREAGWQFTEKGYAGTSLNSVAKALNLTKAGLYHYVDTKEQLLYLCYSDAIDSAEKIMTEAENVDGNALDKLSYYIRCHLAPFGQPAGFHIILSEFFALSEEHEDSLRTRAKEIDNRMVRLIESGVAEGSIQTKNAQMSVYAMQGALNWMPKWFSPDGQESIEEIADDFLDLFVNGLKRKSVNRVK